MVAIPLCYSTNWRDKNATVVAATALPAPTNTAEVIEPHGVAPKVCILPFLIYRVHTATAGLLTFKYIFANPALPQFFLYIQMYQQVMVPGTRKGLMKPSSSQLHHLKSSGFRNVQKACVLVLLVRFNVNWKVPLASVVCPLVKCGRGRKGSDILKWTHTNMSFLALSDCNLGINLERLKSEKCGRAILV